jgi:DNA-binding FadR family transcriptional regulator
MAHTIFCRSGKVLRMDGKLPRTTSRGAAAIVAQLHQAILRGEHANGERLPAERHLAQHFGTSRSTVREALRQLEEMALVTRRIGSGTFVTNPAEPGEAQVAENTSPLELIEVRQAIEPHMARMAVAHATARDLEALAAALAALESSGADRELFSSADERFHLALAEATDNPLMVWLYRQINAVRGHAQWAEMKRKILTRDNIDLYNAQHRQLYEAIRRRDIEAAARCIDEHLDKARRDLLGAG